ncbi:hypothetical protein CTI14_59970, partial [Methylobacterium radiotolerans]
NIDVFSVKLGDCMLETGSGMLTDANVVPCSEPQTKRSSTRSRWTTASTRRTPSDADRDEETGQVTESANIDVFSVKLGDCMLETGSGMLTDANVVPCSEP